MAKDFYLDAAQQRMTAIEAERASALADLQACRVNDDADGAAVSVQTLADLAAAEQNLRNLVNQYQQSQMPAAPLSQEEKMARPWEKMTYEDAWDLANTSKHGAD